MISYKEPRISELIYKGVDVRVLHEYDNHPTVSGNKWWKLKHNLEAAKRQGFDSLLTFGGAYSNHIYATAAAAKIEGFKSIGIIRGEEVDNLVLSFARSQGMELRFVSREDYRKKTEMEFEGIFVIPEGGTNDLAIEACAEWGRKLSMIEFDQLYLAVGTGGTMEGLKKGIEGKREVIGVPVLKGMTGENLLSDYHHGGYGKMPPALLEFCYKVRREYKLILEPVYTGKLFWAVFDQIDKGLIKKGTTIIVIHTGGINFLLSPGAM
ncbi:MAG TPA: 1-aminocyclopropane-1-carboxylate deaminase/D-cysteine desulfhydrase [Cyclobacteriaceae bacterium]|nr:1-aminocyclopropane-1-carboxylate deaminase/D-cysteine desulfhydrase [Cyclobacteriaceae bacterium]